MTRTRTFRYVPFALVLDYERLGWVHDPRPLPDHQAQYVALCWWLCECPMREPKR